MTPQLPAEIAVIVINYGTAGLAVEAVESVLARHHGGRRVEIHLVDNASPGDDAAQLTEAHLSRRWGSAVTLHLEHINHGFGRGNNLVLEALAKRDVPPRYVFFLNPDARLENETIMVLADFLDVHQAAAIAGAAIHRPNGGPRVTAAFRFPGFFSEFANGSSLGPISRLLSPYIVALPAELPTTRVDWVSGAAFLARFEDIRHAGFFNPIFFLYFEEVDLMKKVSEQGGEVWHVSEAVVVHTAGAATGMKSGRHRDSALPDYWFDSWRRYFSCHYGRMGALTIAVARLFGWSMHRLVSFLSGRNASVPLGFGGSFAKLVVYPLLTGHEDG